MQLSDLLLAIKTEARVKSGTQWDLLITQIMQEQLAQFGLKNRYSECLLPDQPITLVAGQANYALPAHFQHIYEVRYSQDGTRFIPLYEFNEGQTRIDNTFGWPRFYFLSGALVNTGSTRTINVFPSANIATTDTLFVSYYMDPASVFANPTDFFPIPKLEPAVKKATIARVIRMMQQFEEAQLMGGDAGTSFINSLSVKE